ncbi:MAG: alpha-amylase family glycosyl hydrolase [Ignavibacteriaceae bacterium]
MKKYLLFFLFGLCQISFSQPVQLDPVFATENDSITIYFDATQSGAEELLNYSGTIYAHTGVNTNLGNWQHVIGSWGDNQTQPSLTRLSTNLYKLTIGFPRQFYNVINSTEKILEIAIVLRSEDASLQTRPDIFIKIYEPGLNVSIIEPTAKPLFVNLNDSVKIVAVSSGGTEINLFVNDSIVASVNKDSLVYYLKADNFDKKRVVAEVVLGPAHALDSTYLIVRKPETVQVQPSGVINGINYTGSSSVTFSLYAPFHQNVYVIGDFTNWEVDPDYQMKVTPDHYTYWIDVNGLTPQKEYIFQYLVDENLKIADPYSEKISDPNDQYINNSTYPNLIQYPAGKTSQIASVLQTDQTPYQWQTTNFERPAKTDLVIYELLIRDFIAEHNYNTLIDTLNYLKQLGVNAIELMPVMEFEGNESWGYNPDFLFAPDKYYGTKNDLKRFIDTAHQMGIAIIFDIVLNHQYGQSPLVRLYWDAINNRPAANNPWFNVTSPNSVFSFGYDLNHESIVTQLYVDRVNKYWLTEYKIDGYRFDFTKGFTNKPGDGGSFDQSRINILERMTDKIWDVDSSAYVILEHFAPNTEETILANYGMMLWGNMNSSYNEATMGYHDGGKSNLYGASYKSRGWIVPHLVSYMESHDEERLMYKNLQFGNSSGDYNVKDLGTALNRMKLASAFYFTIPGPKMIWQFCELGYDVSIDFNGRIGNKPIRWFYYQDPKRLNLYKTFQAIIKLKEYNAFRTNNAVFDLVNSVKRINLTDSSMDVSIIGNFDVIQKDANPNFSQTGYWYDYFSGDSIEVTNTIAPISLAPGEFHIYTTKKLPTPEQGILTDIDSNDEVETVPSTFSLEQNYPNPFNPSTKIRYSVPNVVDAKFASATIVQLKIYDILGNEVAKLVNKEQPPGNYEVEFSAAHNLSSGVYFYRLQAGSFLSSKKMLLLK